MFQKTYELLIQVYGQQGDTDTIARLMELMKKKKLPIPRSLYSAVVNGYSQSGNLEAAEEVITGLEADGSYAQIDVYSSLLCAYAKRGLMENIEMVRGRGLMENIREVRGHQEGERGHIRKIRDIRNVGIHQESKGASGR